MCLAAHLTCCHRSEILDSGYNFISFKCLLSVLRSCYSESYASLMIVKLSVCLELFHIKTPTASVGNLLWISLHISQKFYLCTLNYLRVLVLSNLA